MDQARFHCATLLMDDVYQNDIKSQLNNMALNNGIFLVSTLFIDMYINDSNNYLFQQEKLKKMKAHIIPTKELCWNS